MYPYIRHTIAGVRLAVVKALYTFATADISRSDWMRPVLFSLLFQNLALEERADIREVTFTTFIAGVKELEEQGALETVTCSLGKYYGIVMTPIGSPLDPKLFEKVGKGSLGHNVDKPMMAGDLSLVSMETMLETRIAAAKALAHLRSYNLDRMGPDHVRFPPRVVWHLLTASLRTSTTCKKASDQQAHIRFSSHQWSFRSGLSKRMKLGKTS